MHELPKYNGIQNPLFKNGDRSLACIYRPVSLTCVPCKLLEHIVYSNIMAHLDEHKLLSDEQHAFRKWHSCETQLATVINDWAKILDNKGQAFSVMKHFQYFFFCMSASYFLEMAMPIRYIGAQGTMRT